MKDVIKVILVILSAIICAAIPACAFYFAWSWAMGQVPVANEWAGLIKVAISLLMLIVGGGITLTLSFIGMAIGGAFACALLGLGNVSPTLTGKPKNSHNCCRR